MRPLFYPATKNKEIHLMSVVGKSALVDAIATDTGLPKKTVATVVDALTREIITSVADNGTRVRLPGLGTFELVETPARTGRNPRTGEPMVINAKRRLRFRGAAGALAD
jgi:DNA-binding protein HU-beta